MGTLRFAKIAVGLLGLAGSAHAQQQTPNRPDASPAPSAAYATVPPTPEPREYEMLVFSRPMPGRDAEFNEWYDKQHVSDILAVPGIIAGQRFALAMDFKPQPVPPPHLVVFSFRTRDLVALTGETRRRMLEKVFVPSDAFDYASTVSGIYEKLGPAVSAVADAQPDVTAARGETTRRYTMVVLSEPVAGQAEEYNRWYDQQHVPDVLRVPGFKSAQRYLAKRRVPETAIPPYLALYAFDSADLEATRAEIVRRIKSGQTKTSPSFNGATSVTRFYRAVTPLVRDPTE